MYPLEVSSCNPISRVNYRVYWPAYSRWVAGVFFLEVTDGRTTFELKIALIAIFFSPGEIGVCLVANAHRWLASNFG